VIHAPPPLAYTWYLDAFDDRSLVAQKRRTVEVDFCAEFLERGAREANVRDKRMSSDVKYVGLLAMEMM